MGLPKSLLFMSDEIIIQQLRDKETQLLQDLERVRLALSAFINTNIGFATNQKIADTATNDIPNGFNSSDTYAMKILYILKKEARPMLVEEIVQSLHCLDPKTDVEKVHKNVSYNLSMLAKYAKIKKHPFNRKIKYSL